MLLRLLLLFTLAPLAELAILIWVAQHTSLAFTVVLVLATGIVGAALARYEGFHCWQRAHEALDAGRLPSDPLLDALMILVAGALLITPGILTDLVGFALLMSPFRRIIKRRLKRWFLSKFDIVSQRDEIIDTRVIDVPSEEQDD